MPGRSYTAAQKVEAGLALDRLGVEFIQAGFAITGERDRTAIAELARQCDADVVSLARAVPRDVEAALDAEADVVEVFAPLSDQQLEHLVGNSREEMLDAMRETVDLVRDGGAKPHLILVDAFRTDTAHVAPAFGTFADVEYVGLADTVGARTPHSVGRFLDDLAEAGVDLERASVHFHDDVGVATANALVAAEKGVGKADVSVASLGERAGNTALEELVVAGVVDYDDSFGVDERELIPVCRDVLNALGEDVDPRKSVLGSEVTEHESGIHTAAMLSDPSVMEPFDPATFGGQRTLLFGEKTGKGGARKLLGLADRSPTDELVEALLSVLAERGPVEQEEAVALARDC